MGLSDGDVGDGTPASHRRCVQPRSRGRKGVARQHSGASAIPLRASCQDIHIDGVVRIIQIAAPRPSGRGSVAARSGVCPNNSSGPLLRPKFDRIVNFMRTKGTSNKSHRARLPAAMQPQPLIRITPNPVLQRACILLRDAWNFFGNGGVCSGIDQLR